MVDTHFDRYDEELDQDSGIELLMRDYNGEQIVAARDPSDSIAVPPLPNLCGHVYGILYMVQNAEINVDRTKHNNFAMDTVTLQCHENGENNCSRARVLKFHLENN